MANVFNTNNAINHHLAPARAAFQSATPFQGNVQAINKSIIGPDNKASVLLI